jgi:hypothetical protein
MYPFTADIHLHPDGARRGNSRHGERPKRLAESIERSGIDVYALSEHHYATEETQKVHRKMEGIMTGRRQKRTVVGFDGVELSASFRGLPFHIGYVFENRLALRHPEDFPEVGADIESAEFSDWRALFPGIAIVNHPAVTHKIQTVPKRIELTTAMLTEGIVDGCEVLNGALLLNGKNGSSVEKTIGAARAFIHARLQRTQIAIIGSSDAHWAKYRMKSGKNGMGKLITGPGCVRTQFMADSQDQLLDAIRAGRTKAVVHERYKIREIVGQVLQAVPEIEKFIRLHGE